MKRTFCVEIKYVFRGVKHTHMDWFRADDKKSAEETAVGAFRKDFNPGCEVQRVSAH